jgi:hypothetical protein
MAGIRIIPIEMKDPNTGQFVKGNPGRIKGTKNTRTVQWEELGKEITEANAGRFNELLGRLWDSSEVTDQLRAAELFLKVAEFFKPKLQRIQTPDLPGVPLPAPQIIITRQIIGRDGKITEEREP